MIRNDVNLCGFIPPLNVCIEETNCKTSLQISFLSPESQLVKHTHIRPFPCSTSFCWSHGFRTTLETCLLFYEPHGPPPKHGSYLSVRSTPKILVFFAAIFDGLDISNKFTYRIGFYLSLPNLVNLMFQKVNDLNILIKTNNFSASVRLPPLIEVSEGYVATAVD